MTQPTSALAGHGDPGLAPSSPAPEPGRRTVGVVARALFLLTKPRIIELLLVTTLPTMFLAAPRAAGHRPDRRHPGSAARSLPAAPTR